MFICSPDFILKIMCAFIQIFMENSHILYESVVILKMEMFSEKAAPKISEISIKKYAMKLFLVKVIPPGQH